MNTDRIETAEARVWDEAVEATTAAIWAEPGRPRWGWRTPDNPYLLGIPAAGLRVTREQRAAVFHIEGTHHFHGTKCLCGFDSHGRARSMTEHITGLTLAALGVTVVDEDPS